MQTAPLPANAALPWIRESYARVLREPARWLGMTLVYLAIALVLKRVPFLGNFVLVLITPIMLAGALFAARSPPAPAPAGAGAWLTALTRDAAQELFQVLRREEHTFAVVIVCILSLGLIVLVNIPELLITGGSVVSGLTGASLAGPLRLSLVLGIVVVIALYVLLAMALLYVVPLTLFGNRQPVPAVAESFRACLDNRAALAWFAAPFLAVNLAILVGFAFSRPLGYALLLVLGLVSLPAFVVALHASYRTLFESAR